MPLDEADKTFIGDLIKSSITELTGDLDKKYATNDAVQQIVTQGLEGLDIGAKVTEAVKEATKDLKAPAPPKPAPKEGDGEPSAEVLKLQEQIDEMQRKNQEADQARIAAEEREQANRLRGAITEAMGAAQIPADRHAQALAFLQTLKTDKGTAVLGFDDSGQPVWHQQKNGYVDKMKMSDGLKAWTESDAGKLYLPPVDTKGAGGGGGRPQPSGGNAPRTKEGGVDWGAVGSRLNANGLAAATGT